MATEITNANDVELVIKSVSRSNSRGTAQSMGRIVVDDFSVTVNDGSETVSGVGVRKPIGYTNGDIDYDFSWTMMGDDVETFAIITSSDGVPQEFNFTAKKTNDSDDIEWEKSLTGCKANSEEISGSSGDPIEHAVEGFALDLDNVSDTGSVWNGSSDDSE